MKSTTFNIKSKFIFSMLIIAALSYSCSDFEKFELPETGSIPDETPPSANFSYQQGEEEDYLTYTFGNLSNSAIEYAWNFGDGGTSIEKEPTYTFPDTMDYTVTLVASDALGASASHSETIEVRKPPAPKAKLPVIMEAGFEDNSLPGGTGDGRDSWRCSFGTVMQITSGPVNSGAQAAKWPTDDQRVAYQELEVSPNTDYILKYFYTMKTSGTGDLTVRVMDGPVTALPVDPGNTLGSHVGTDQTDANAYVEVAIPFNTGATETIAILITNDVLGVESRLDDVSIELVE